MDINVPMDIFRDMLAYIKTRQPVANAKPRLAREVLVARGGLLLHSRAVHTQAEHKILNELFPLRGHNFVRQQRLSEPNNTAQARLIETRVAPAHAHALVTIEFAALWATHVQIHPALAQIM